MADIDQEIRDDKQGMTPIVKTIVRFALGIMIIFGVYIVLYGHLTPGGGFAGGVILACGYIILTLAFGKDVALRKLSNTGASILDNLGALAFIVIGIIGFSAGFFFKNFLGHGRMFDLWSAGTIPLCNIAIGIKVMASLFAIFVALSIFGKFIYKLVDEDEVEKE
ncbi:MAG TPA: MnhB domain-containing protein [Patescibacteria group bacterium]|nr:MnhB domain-containing protein [Patescibacteria group bacterium]